MQRGTRRPEGRGVRLAVDKEVTWSDVFIDDFPPVPRLERVERAGEIWLTILPPKRRSAGVHVRAISDRLGHASTRMTLDVYSQVLEPVERDATERIEGAVFGRG